MAARSPPLPAASAVARVASGTKHVWENSEEGVNAEKLMTGGFFCRTLSLGGIAFRFLQLSLVSFV